MFYILKIFLKNGGVSKTADIHKIVFFIFFSAIQFDRKNIIYIALELNNIYRNITFDKFIKHHKVF